MVRRAPRNSPAVGRAPYAVRDVDAWLAPKPKEGEGGGEPDVGAVASAVRSTPVELSEDGVLRELWTAARRQMEAAKSREMDKKRAREARMREAEVETERLRRAAQENKVAAQENAEQERRRAAEARDLERARQREERERDKQARSERDADLAWDHQG